MNTHIFKLQDDENIVTKVGYHWVMYVGSIVNGIFLAVLPIIIFIIAEQYMFLTPTPIVLKTILLLYLLWLIALWTATLAQLTIMALNQWVITDRRIVSIDQTGFFDTLIASWQYNNIIEVSAEKKGLFQTMLNYGHIEIQTAGMADEYEQMSNVADPETIRSLIIRQLDDYSIRRDEIKLS